MRKTAAHLVSSQCHSLPGNNDDSLNGGSLISMRKDFSFPTLHNGDPHCADFSPSYKLTRTTRSILPTLVNSLDSSSCAVHDGLTHSKLRTDPTTIGNNIDRKMKFNLTLKQNRSGNFPHGPGTLTESDKVYRANKSPARSTMKNRSDAISMEISGNNSFIKGYSGLTYNSISHEMDQETAANFYSQVESESLCEITHDPLGVFNTDTGVTQALNNIPSNSSESDTVKLSNHLSGVDLEVCSSKSPGQSTTVSEATKSSTLFPVSSMTSTRIKRHRQIEREQVHQVYKEIAPYCDHVRQRAWPRVKRFLKEVEPGSLVVDVGCGNGRYLNINSSIFKIGCDLCPPFLEQARSQGHEVMISDNIALPYRDSTFDAVISIGVIHHFASLGRRIKAISELARILSPGGRLMIYVWAFEQIHRKFEGQDVLIPWVKPEIKDHTRRNSISCSSESDSIGINFRGGSASVVDGATPTLRRRHRHESHKRNSSVAERSRSKSLDDRGLAKDARCRHSSTSGHFMSQMFGVFDRRDSNANTTKLIQTCCTKGQGILLDETSKRERENNPVNDDPSTISKWPGQLVSECRKLGKFLRSLSNKSDGQGNGDAADLGDNVQGAISDLLLRCDNNPDSETSTGITKDNTSCQTHTRRCINKQFSTEEEGITAVTQTYQRKPEQKDYYPPCVRNIRSAESDPCIASSESTITPLNSCLRDISDNTNISTLNTAITYHSNSNTTSFTTRTRTSMVESHSSRRHNARSFTYDASSYHSLHKPDSSQTPCMKTTEALPSLNGLHFPSPVGIFSSSEESDVASPEHQVDSSLSSGEVPECNDLVILEPPSEPCSIMSEQSIQSHSNKSLIDAPIDSNTNTCKCLHYPKLHTKLKMSSNCETSFEKSLDSLLEYVSDYCLSNDVTSQPSAVLHLNSGKSKEQHCLDNGSNPILEHFQEEARDDMLSPSNTSTEVNYVESDKDDSTDFMDSDSVFSLNQDICRKRNNVCQRSKETYSTINPKTIVNMNPREVASSELNIEMRVDKHTDNAPERDDIAKESIQQTPDYYITDDKQYRQVLSNETSPFRVTVKTILHKLADYFHINSRNESKTFGCYDNGRSPASRRVVDSDSSESNTPISSFSTHSSCYPGLFAVSKDKASSEKRESTPGKDRNKTTSKNGDDIVDITNNSHTLANYDNILPGNESNERRPLRIDVPDNNQDFRQDFVNDVSERAEQSVKDIASNSPCDSYMFQVDNLSHATVKKNSLLHTLSQKWSEIFNKDDDTDQKMACLHYSTSSLSSSDNNEENLKISLVESNKSSIADCPHTNRTLTRRPSSLDFTKKRTRRKGRKPAPRKDDRENDAQYSGEYEVHSREKRSHTSMDDSLDNTTQSERLLTLSDAMTLLGDGATEDSIISRLDDSAKTIFVEMKRMRFAIRMFPMSSVDSDSNDDVTKDMTDIVTVPDYSLDDEEDAPTNPLAFQMCRDRRVFSSHRMLSDSVSSQAGKLKKKRSNVLRHQQIIDEDSTKSAHQLQRQYLSEDLVSFFEMFGIQNRRQKSHFVFNRSQETKPGHNFTSLDSMVESQKGCIGSQEQFKNGQWPADSSNNANTFSSSKEGDEFELKEVESSNGNTTNNYVQTGIAQMECDASESVFTRRPSSALLYDGEREPTKYSTNDESTKRLNITKSFCQTGNVVANDNESSLITCSQSDSNCSPIRSFKYSSTNQNNAESIPVSVNQSKSIVPKTNSSLSRYYHVFKKGELDQLVTRHVPSLKIVDTFYDHANWCIIAEKV